MRRLAPADLSAAARALLAMPAEMRANAARRMVVHAEAADRFRKRLGRAHPFWGAGTLEGAARAHALAPPQSLSNAGYLACLAQVLDALIERAEPAVRGR